MENTISTIALFASLAGNVLINMQKRAGFVVWILANLMWIAYNVTCHLNWQQLAMYAVYTALSAHGFMSLGKKTKASSANA